MFAALSDRWPTPRTPEDERHIASSLIHLLRQSFLKQSELSLPAAFIIIRFSFLSALSPTCPPRYTAPADVKKSTE
jgi:hypothetical protein